MAVRRGLAVTAALATGVVTALAIAPPSVAGGRHTGRPSSSISVLADGLEGPYGLDSLRGGEWVVAENGANQVTRIDRRGGKHVLVSGAGGVSGVAAGRNQVFSVLGGPNETGEPTPGDYPASSVLRTDLRTGRTAQIADLLTYELDHNPDGQAQFDNDHVPYDALSNPFSATLTPWGLLVADGGANDVLRVDPRTGHISTFFVPPTVTDVPACLADGAQANPGTVGCDPVPTGVAVRGGKVYISTLGAEVPGAGRVYQVDPRHGRILRVWKNLDSPTGVAVGGDGSIYVSEVLEGAPEGDGPPPDGFDPSTVGQITKISPRGHVTHAQVTMPTGLRIVHGELYSTAWSVAGFLGISGAGQVVHVGSRAFS